MSLCLLLLFSKLFLFSTYINSVLQNKELLPDPGCRPCYPAVFKPACLLFRRVGIRTVSRECQHRPASDSVKSSVISVPFIIIQTAVWKNGFMTENMITNANHVIKVEQDHRGGGSQNCRRIKPDTNI